MVSHVFYGTIQTESPADSLNREQAKAGRAPQTSSSVMGNLTVDEMVFNDGEWHTFKLIRETTGWEMTIDDYNCINAPYDDLNLV